jgi:hypothetical protein
MNTTIPSALLQEIQDLLIISTIDPELKTHIQTRLTTGNITPTLFQQLLALLREEDKLDKDMQKYSDEIVNFDPDQYLDHVQAVVNTEAQKYLNSN